YRSHADSVSEEICDTLWSEEDQRFYAKNHTGHIPVVSVSNLFPIMLPNIREEQAKSILNMLDDPEWFGTNYPIPSVPTNSPAYDGEYSEKRIWRGPTWINMNYFITQGLVRQR